MSVEHGVSANLDFILAGCLMNQEEREVVAAIIEEREEGKEETVTERKEDTAKEEKTVMEETIVVDCEVKFEAVEPLKNNSCEFCSNQFLSKQSLFLHNKKNHKDKLQRKSNNSIADIVLANVEPPKKKSRNEQLSLENILTEEEQDIMKTEKDPKTLTVQEIFEDEILIDEVPKKEKTKLEQRNHSNDVIVYKEDAQNIKKMEQQQKIFEEITAKSRNEKTQEKKHQNGGLSFDCEVCYEKFQVAKDLRYHKFREHENAKNMGTMCNICNKDFVNESKLQEHKKTKHGDIKEADAHNLKPFVKSLREFKPSMKGRKTKSLGGNLQSIKSQNPNRSLGGIMKPIKSHNPNRSIDVTDPNEKQKIVMASDFFKNHPNDLKMYDGKDELKEVENLPPGWKIGEHTILTSGRKIVSFISPDQVLSFRSRVGVFEYLKFEARYSEEELQNFSKMMKVKVSTSQ